MKNQGKCNMRYRQYSLFFLIPFFIFCVFCLMYPFLFAQNQLRDRKIVVGGDYNYPPYEYLDESGRPAGYNVELTKALMEELGLRYEIRLGPWGEIRQALETGEIDVIHGMFYSSERDRTVDFTPPHTYIYHAVFARKGDNGITSPDDIRGKEIIVMEGDIMHEYVLQHQLTAHPVLVKDQAEALKLLAEGKHDYALIAELPGLYWIDQLDLDNIQLAGPSLLSVKYCYATLEKNMELLHLIGQGLAILNQTGEYQEIWDEWLGVYDFRSHPLQRFFKYLIAGLLALLISAAVVFLWILALRRTVASQTSELNQEIFQRQQVQEELEKSEIRYRSIFENSPEAILFTEPGGRVFDANPAACRLLGRTKEEICTLGREGIMDITDERITEALKESRGEGVFFGELNFRRSDGTPFPVEVTSGLFSDGEGRKRSIIFMRDISEKKLMERELQENEERLRYILDSIPDMVLQLDRDMRILWANKSALEKNRHAAGKTCYDAFPGRKGVCEGCPCYRAFKTGQIEWATMYQPASKTAGEGYWENIGIPQKNKDGEIETVIEISRNITERVISENRIRDSLREKETLLQEIHHRVKNNMNVVSSLLQLQGSSADDERVREALKESQGRIYAMSAVHEILHNSKNLAEIDLKAYLENLVNILIQTFTHNKRNIAFSVYSDKITLTAEEASPLGLTVNELVSNSLKYAFPDDRAGEVRIEAAAHNGQLILVVKDNGIGLPVDLDWKNSSSLGLKLVRSLVENQLEGSVALTSDHGTTFTISFPFRAE